MDFRPPKLFLIWACLIIFCTPPAYALDKHQQDMVRFAYTLGGQTEVAIIETESSVCRHRIGDHGLAFGCGQLHCQAVHALLWRCPVHRLIYDDRFNVVVSTAYLAWCTHQTGSWGRALVCYHDGIRIARKCGRKYIRDNHYVRLIQSRLHDFQSLYAAHPPAPVPGR